jgi:hypothetical protein
MSSIEKVALWVVGLAIVATLVVNGTGTANVIKAGTGGFSTDITAAEKG